MSVKIIVLLCSFLISISLNRESAVTWLNDHQSTDSATGNSSIGSETSMAVKRRIGFSWDTTRSDSSLITFNRNNPSRIAQRRKFRQNSVPTIIPSIDLDEALPSVKNSGSKKHLRSFRLKKCLYRKLRKIFR